MSPRSRAWPMCYSLWLWGDAHPTPHCAASSLHFTPAKQLRSSLTHADKAGNSRALEPA